MKNYDDLADALSMFLGSRVSAEDILSFDFRVEDSRTDFIFESSLDLSAGLFKMYVSDYVASLKQHSLEAESSEELEGKLPIFTKAIRELHDGLCRLDSLNKTIRREGSELDADVVLDKITSTYRATLGKKTLFTRNPGEMADALETYLKSCKASRLDQLNERLAVYTDKQVVFGDNFEWYMNGVFLSIYYRTKTNFVVTFHPGVNVDQWLRFECSSMKSFNEAVDKILRRLS